MEHFRLYCRQSDDTTVPYGSSVRRLTMAVTYGGILGRPARVWRLFLPLAVDIVFLGGPITGMQTNAHLRCACNHVLHIICMTWAVDMGIMPLVCLILHCRQQQSLKWVPLTLVANESWNMQQTVQALGTICLCIPWAVAIVMPRAFSSGACIATHPCQACVCKV